MWYVCQFFRQDTDLFLNGLVLVHHEHMLIPDLAKAAFDLETGCFQILFGNGDLQTFGQIYEFLIQLIGFHVLKLLHVLKIATDVLL